MNLLQHILILNLYVFLFEYILYILQCLDDQVFLINLFHFLLNVMFSAEIEYKYICFISTVFAVSLSNVFYTSSIAPLPINSPN